MENDLWNLSGPGDFDEEDEEDAFEEEAYWEEFDEDDIVWIEDEEYFEDY